MKKKSGTKIQNIDHSNEFRVRLDVVYDELKWLYMELYDDMQPFEDLVANLENIYKVRNENLKSIDREKENKIGWFKLKTMIGMNISIPLFGGNIKKLTDSLDYVKNTGVNFIHLLPLFESPNDMSDDGFAVSNFRQVDSKYGSNDDFIELIEECKKRNILVSTDFVINHTSDKHQWAMWAKEGNGEYIGRYIFFDGYDLPSQYEKTVPCRLPNLAPGNFTYIECINKHVMTSFNHYQWDLNYANPIVFNEMIYNLLYVANMGVDVLKLAGVEYTWKELGTRCRGLKQTHSILRMFRLITQVVCPSLMLSTKIDDEYTIKDDYFGTKEKPECHFIYNDDVMVNIWNGLATRDVRMLDEQLELQENEKAGSYINYLRSFNEMNFFLPESLISKYGFDPVKHRKFLGEFFRGVFPDSFARGELFSFDPYSGEFRGCGTTSSLCGLEKALYEDDMSQVERSINRMVMIYTLIGVLQGFPMINSTDEYGQLNDYTYKEDSVRLVDSKNLHRVKFDEEKSKKIFEKGTIENRIFSGIKNMTEIRKKYSDIFDIASTKALHCANSSVLVFERNIENASIVCMFNFSEQTKEVNFLQIDGIWEKSVKKCVNVKTGRKCKLPNKIKLDGYAFAMYMLELE